MDEHRDEERLAPLPQASGEIERCHPPLVQEMGVDAASAGHIDVRPCKQMVQVDQQAAIDK